MRKPKVIIVGAGPAGGACAAVLATSGRAEVVVVDKSKYPRVKVCGSGLSPFGISLLKTLGLADKFEKSKLFMAGITAVGPGGLEIHLRGQSGAWVVPRVELDHGIVSHATAHGATLLEDTKVTEILTDRQGHARGVKTSQGELEADMVVCANGSPSRFERQRAPRNGIRTIMGWWEGVALRRADEGIMIWDRRLDGYYAWAFPEPGGITNIGITVPERSEGGRRVKPLFEEILSEHFGRALRYAQQRGKWMGHPATVTNRVGDIAAPRTLFVGEAARLVSPATVEGIAFAMESGIRAARIIADRLDPSIGLTPVQRAMYRAGLGASMLPKFWAAEGFYRVMRSEQARKFGRMLNTEWLAKTATRLVGETPV